MPDLNFNVEKAEPVTFAAAPLLHFKLRITEAEGQNIHAIALRCQIRIEPARRHYEPAEKERLIDLFGEPSRWGQTLKSLLWTHASVVVPPFTGSTTVDLPVPCSYDFNLAASKYFYAMEKEDVALCLMFSGTIFYETPEHSLQVAQIPWDKESNFRLPVRVWREMMDHYYPNSAWLCLRKDVFDRLAQFKSRQSLTSWESAIGRLLDEADEQVPT
ncbi:MAG TPA: DUF6084 family protein [Tepidisphaeraceae bacterium]|nr:DUF6084 family protein [Tepidisphaeraceae bacterium]